MRCLSPRSLLALSFAWSVSPPLAASEPPPDLTQLGEQCADGAIDACERLLSLARTDADPAVRQAAVEHLTDQARLAQIARESTSVSVRVAAVGLIADPEVLAAFATDDPMLAVRGAAVRRIADQELLERVAAADASPAVRAMAAGRIEDPARVERVLSSTGDPATRAVIAGAVRQTAVLARLSASDPSPLVRQAALRALGHGPTLQRALYCDPDADVQRAAATALGQPGGRIRDVQRALLASIDEPRLLADIATCNPDHAIAMQCVRRISTPELLTRIAETAVSVSARSLAAQRLRSLGPPPVAEAPGAANAAPRSPFAERARLMALALVLPESGRRAAVAELAALPAPQPEAGQSWIDDQAALVQLALRSSDPVVRTLVEPLVVEPALLIHLATASENADVSLAAIRRVTDRVTLGRLAATHSSQQVRQAAQARLRLLGGGAE